METQARIHDERRILRHGQDDLVQCLDQRGQGRRFRPQSVPVHDAAGADRLRAPTGHAVDTCHAHRAERGTRLPVLLDDDDAVTLQEMIGDGTFRQDTVYGLRVFRMVHDLEHVCGVVTGHGGPEAVVNELRGCLAVDFLRRGPAKLCPAGMRLRQCFGE